MKKMNEKIFKAGLDKIFISIAHEAEKISHETEHIYTTLYSNLEIISTTEKELFSTLHSLLNYLISFMNKKSQTNKIFNADQSKILLELIDIHADFQELYHNFGNAFQINGSYILFLDEAKKFVQRSGSSFIPETYKPFKIQKFEAIYSVDKLDFAPLGQKELLSWEDYQEDLTILKKRLQGNDNRGIVTLATSLLEYQMKQLYKDKTGNTFRGGGFMKLWKDFSAEFNLKNDPTKETDMRIREIQDSLLTIMKSFIRLRNEASDSHANIKGRGYILEDHHGRFIAGIALSLIVFFDAVSERSKQSS